jgi:hypothetical protein
MTRGAEYALFQFLSISYLCRCIDKALRYESHSGSFAEANSFLVHMSQG